MGTARFGPDRLSAAVRAALTFGLWLRGRASTDEVLVAGAFPDRAADPLAQLALLRQRAATHAWVAGGRPGRPDPVSGATCAVVFSSAPAGADALTLAPLVAVWEPTTGIQQLPAQHDTLRLLADSLTPAQANRALLATMSETAAVLEGLGLQRARPDLVADLSRAVGAALPRELDEQVARVVERAEHLRALARAALADEGAAVTAGESDARTRPLLALAAQADDVLAGAANGLNLLHPR